MQRQIGEKTHVCEFCSSSFEKKGDLVRHIKTHTREKPYSCGFCSDTFSLKSNLNDDRRTHIGEKPYNCTCVTLPLQQKQLWLIIDEHIQEKGHIPVNFVAIPFP